MHVEDVLIKIRDKLSLYIPPYPGQKYRGVRPFGGMLDDPWHSDFIRSVGAHIDGNRSLSTKQAEIILKIIDRVKSHIVNYGWIREDQIDNLLSFPVYRQPLYESTNVPREVRHIGDNLLAFRCKADKTLAEKIKNLSEADLTSWLPMVSSHNRPNYANVVKPRFDFYYKVWIVSIYRFNFNSIMNLISDNRFKMDDDTLVYMNMVHDSFEKSSIVTIDNDILLANVCDDPILAAWMTEMAEGVKL